MTLLHEYHIILVVINGVNIMKIGLLTANLTINSQNNKKDKTTIKTTTHKAITSVAANQFGVAKSCIAYKNLSFGIKRVKFLAPNATRQEIPKILFDTYSKPTIDDILRLKREYLLKNKIVANYCLKFMSGNKVENLTTDEMCEQYIASESQKELKNLNKNLIAQCLKTLEEQASCVYEKEKEKLPDNPDELKEQITRIKQTNNLMSQEQSSSFKTNTKSQNYPPKNDKIRLRFLVYGELVKQDMLNGMKISQTADNFQNLLQICAYATISSMNETDFTNFLLSEEKKDANFLIPEKLMNILKGTELVFSNFNQDIMVLLNNLDIQKEDVLQLGLKESDIIKTEIGDLVNQFDITYRSLIISSVCQTINKLKIKLLEKRLQEIKSNKTKETSSSENNEIQQISDEKQKVNTKKKKRKKKHVLPPTAVAVRKEVVKTDSENSFQDNLPQTIQHTENSFQEDVKLNGEFNLVGITLENTLADLDHKKVFSTPDSHDGHERFLANNEVVNIFFSNLMKGEVLDENIKKCINFDQKEISETQQHFVGSVLARLKTRNPNMTLNETIKIVAGILNNGVLVHSLTKNCNAKLDIYSPEYQLMIPFELDSEKQTIQLKTILDFENKNLRQNRFVKNPRNQSLSGYGNLDKFHEDLVARNIETATLQNTLSLSYGMLAHYYK